MSRIVITPSETLVIADDDTATSMHPTTISIVLDDGQMFSIQEIAVLLKKKCKIKKESKVSRFSRAFQFAMKDMEAAEKERS